MKVGEKKLGAWRNIKGIFGVSAVGGAGYGANELRKGYNWLQEKLGDFTLPAVATATAGLIGGALGNRNIASLAMALTMGSFALDHVSEKGLPGADLIAKISAPEQTL
jgi:hypothetical protein